MVYSQGVDMAIRWAAEAGSRSAPVWLVACCLCLAGCGSRSEEPGGPAGSAGKPASGATSGNDGSNSADDLFADTTRAWGIDFVHRVVEHEQPFFMPRSVGSGAALFDYDADGDLDLYLIHNGGPGSGAVNRLYRQGEGKFEDVGAGSGLDVDGYGMGVACGDVNNDGRVDLLLTEYGRSRLFLNETQDGTPRFRDITEAAGLDNRLWGTSACFADYDRDGWLDMVLVNYVNYDPSRWCADGSSRQDFCGPDHFAGRVTMVYQNQGRGEGEDTGAVRFKDVTVASGLASRPGPGLGVFCADFDGDHWPDIFIANDGKPNHLWMNQKDGTFKEEATSRGLAYNSMGKSEANMGVAIGDVDSNGMFDIFVTHLSDETHTLWSQGPAGIFVDRTAMSGITAAKWRGTGFGTVMADIENDGDLDMLIANGRVTRESGPMPELEAGLPDFWKPYAQRDQIMLNQGQGRFQDVSEATPSLCRFAGVSRGMAAADVNRDGALDILVTRIAGPPSLLINQSKARGHWLLVRAIDPKLNRDAYGAEVYVLADGRQWMRWVNPGYSFLCSNDPMAHFGLGEVTQVTALQVRWPDGTLEEFPGGAVDRQWNLQRGAGKVLETP